MSNEWQPMIDRCKAMADRINTLLCRRASVGTSYDCLTIHNIDDMETILFAVRHTAHRLDVECTKSTTLGNITTRDSDAEI